MVSDKGVFHEGGLSQGWSFTRGVFHEGGLSKEVLVYYVCTYVGVHHCGQNV